MMMDFIKRLFGNDDASSGAVAKDRLKLVLFSDRTAISPEVWEMLKADLINVISQYMEIDEKAFDVSDVSLESNEDNQVALIANIPVKNMKRRVKMETV